MPDTTTCWHERWVNLTIMKNSFFFKIVSRCHVVNMQIERSNRACELENGIQQTAAATAHPKKGETNINKNQLKNTLADDFFLPLFCLLMREMSASILSETMEDALCWCSGHRANNKHRAIAFHLIRCFRQMVCDGAESAEKDESKRADHNRLNTMNVVVSTSPVTENTHAQKNPNKLNVYAFASSFFPFPFSSEMLIHFFSVNLSDLNETSLVFRCVLIFSTRKFLSSLLPVSLWPFLSQFTSVTVWTSPFIAFIARSITWVCVSCVSLFSLSLSPFLHRIFTEWNTVKRSTCC